ncbi:MAG: thioredoxin domain-containing protein [Chloroflexi bacterium]|nr:thioredoxin domain-containing protein [Chloroflexota bacterium]
MPNRLIDETSPYLLQHALNPVDWYPWGEEALARARAEDRPILLSIGYSACHWCHVMERESFENPRIAAMMNDLYINIKVDREERPDLDGIYMTAVQAMTGHGGWPMTVFLTPEGVPFYGGTYFPPEDRGQHPGFPRILAGVAEAYRSRRGDVEKNAEQMRQALQRKIVPQATGPLSTELLDRAAQGVLQHIDWNEGGLGGAPKFPQPMTLEFLLRSYSRTGEQRALDAVTLTLDKMASGGIYDQLGGGFHRYAVDAIWLVPHFEKMLYDNAQLARVYLQAYLVTGRERYRRVVEETLDYVRREMTHPDGGFYSTQDADSEGVEGKFFVWTVEEVDELLGREDGPLFRACFDVTPHGNFEHHNILHVEQPLAAVAAHLGVSEQRLAGAVERGRAILFGAREARIRPHRDEKVLTAWNGMMLRAFAEAGAAFEREDYVAAAVQNAGFTLREVWQEGRLLRTWKDGRARLNGYLEDYACYADGLIALYEATFDARWLDGARRLADVVLARFGDPESGGFFDTADDHEQLVTRPKDIFDNATPSGTSVAADMLSRLGLLTDDRRYTEAAEGITSALGGIAAQHPTSFGRLLCAVDFAVGRPHEIAIVGPPDAEGTKALRRVVFGQFLPNRVVAGAAGPDGGPEIPLLQARPPRDGQPTAYVCERYVCQAPVTDPHALAAQLGDGRQ